MTARLAALSLALLAACSSGGSGGGAAPPATNVSGSWAGSWASSSGAAGGPLDFAVSMTAAGQVTGTGMIWGSPCTTGTLTVTGTVSGTQFQGTFTKGGESVRIFGDVSNPSSIVGSYSVLTSSKGCAGDSGTIHANKVVPLESGGPEPYPAWLLVTDRGAWLIREP